MTKTTLQGELEYLAISNSVADAKIALQGAHLFHFQVKGKTPLLWLSDTAVFKHGKPIRGGIPICWPWFGAHPSDAKLPNHGFARTFLWKHIDTVEINDTETKVRLRLESTKESLRLWPYHFELTLEIFIGTTLRVSLMTKNLGKKEFHLTNALHTYIRVQEISKTKIEGLENKPYYNKVDNSFNNTQTGKLDFSQEVDRIYQEIRSPLQVESGNSIVGVKTEGSKTVVIWNPGETLANKMTDLSGHQTMLCVESANALEDAPSIQKNESHCLSTAISQINRV